MTDKQKRFCEEYLIDCNATQAAIRCGYSPKTAKSQGQRLLTNADVKNWISSKVKSLESNKIADAQEVMEYLSSVLRGESTSEEIVIEGIGDGMSEARAFQKKPSEKEKLKAAELLGKRYSIFTEKVQVQSESVVIVDDIKDTEA